MTSQPDPDATIGRRIRALRSAAGLSQLALAERAGVSRATISGLERDSRLHGITLATVEKIAAALDVHRAAILG